MSNFDVVAIYVHSPTRAWQNNLKTESKEDRKYYGNLKSTTKNNTAGTWIPDLPNIQMVKTNTLVKCHSINGHNCSLIKWCPSNRVTLPFN